MTANPWRRRLGQLPITFNGCIRILSQPNYPNRVPMQQVVNGLRQAMQNPLHEFWADDLNTVTNQAIAWSYTVRAGQLTDVYLLALAVAHEARFVTLDQGIAWPACRRRGRISWWCWEASGAFEPGHPPTGQTRSITIAMPCPTPMHMVHSA